MKVSKFRAEDAGFALTPKGAEALEQLIVQSKGIDLSTLEGIEERIPGDREKIIVVMQNLALGARHREALGDVSWTWSDLSIYKNRYPVVKDLYTQVSRLGDEMRKIERMDEAHRRATEGVEEPIYSPSGKFCGTKLKYSDALLQMFLKADHPDKFSEKHEVKSTGVVLNMQMGLRKDVRQTPMEQGDIVVESPFAEEKEEELPGGV